MSGITKERTAEIVNEYAGSAENTGSTKAQIAIFTHRIKHLSDHLRQNKKDFSCKRTLLGLVGKRKRFLNYLQRKNIEEYRSIIEKLGIRK